MGIAEIIQRKKNEFFVARDSDKLEIQKTELMKQRENLRKERTEIESVRKIQNEIRDERKNINNLKTEGSRRVGQNVFNGFKRLNDNVKKFSNDSPGTGFVNNIGAMSNDNPNNFRGSLNMDTSRAQANISASPFVTGLGNKMTEKPKEKGKTIVIKLNN